MVEKIVAETAQPALGQTLKKTEKVASEVQSASDNLAVVSTVLEQEIPEVLQVGEVAQALEHAAELEKKLARSAEKLAEVKADLAREIENKNTGSAA
ncbi:conserved hypothetical protein [Burkholderiales bacterium 8X]|nr:conserved hypothetical protein [Burkholderiales bacterium 8X]